MGNADLFGTELLPGLSLEDDFLTKDDEQKLIAGIDGAELEPFRFQQWTGKRLTRSYGWSYDFQTGSFEPAEPFPDWLLPIRDRAAHAARLVGEDLAQALVIRYDPGAGIGWHRDRPVFEHVLGISLGHPASLRFRRKFGTKFERTSVMLTPRSLYHLSGEARWDWEHSIVGMEVQRWSITFRTLRRNLEF